MDRADIVAGYLAALEQQAQEPGANFLAALTSAHVARFAFSSVGPMLGEALPLDAGALYARIVEQGRGGYCFEQNGLLFEVLTTLGFDVELCLARVVHNQDIHPGLTHRVSIVTLGAARYVADVGFGPQGPRVPIDLRGVETRDEERRYRVSTRRDGELQLQLLTGGEWYTLYRFELGRYGQADCELGHFYSHRHPGAVFVRNLVASRQLPGEVRSLRNREYRVSRRNAETLRDVATAGQLHELLQREFALRVSEPESRRLFASLP
jgi:N-hydroxyarylamine O-acetyltransferase